MRNFLKNISKVNKFVLSGLFGLMLTLSLFFQNANWSDAWPTPPSTWYHQDTGFTNGTIKHLMPNTYTAYLDLLAHPNEGIAKAVFGNQFKSEAPNVGLRVTKIEGDKIYLASTGSSFKNGFAADVFSAGINGIDISIDMSKVGSNNLAYKENILPTGSIADSFTELTLNNSNPFGSGGAKLYSNVGVNYNPRAFFGSGDVMGVESSPLGFDDPRITGLSKHELGHAQGAQDLIAGRRNIGNIGIENPKGLNDNSEYAKEFNLDEVRGFLDSAKANLDITLKYGPNTPPDIKQAAFDNLIQASKLVASAYNAVGGVQGPPTVNNYNLSSNQLPNGVNQSYNGVNRSYADATQNSTGQAIDNGNANSKSTRIRFPISDLNDKGAAAVGDAANEMRLGASDWLYGADSYIEKGLKTLVDVGALSSNDYNKAIDELVKPSINNPPLGNTGMSARQLMLRHSNGPFVDQAKPFLEKTPNPSASNLFESQFHGVDKFAGINFAPNVLANGSRGYNSNGGDSFADDHLISTRPQINNTIDIRSGTSTYKAPTVTNANPGNGQTTIGRGAMPYEVPPKIIDITKSGADTAILNRAMNEAGNIPNISAKTGNEVMRGGLDPAPIESVKVSDGKGGIEARAPASSGKPTTVEGSAAKSAIPMALAFAAPAYGNAAAAMQNAKTDDQRNQILEEFFKSETDLGISMTYFGVGATGIVVVAGAIGGSAIGGAVATGLGIAFVPILVDQLSDPNFIKGLKDLLDSPDGAKQIANITYKVTANSLSAATMVKWNKLTLRDILNSMKSGNKDWMRVAKSDPKELARQVNRAIDDALWQNDPDHQGQSRNYGSNESKDKGDFSADPTKGGSNIAGNSNGDDLSGNTNANNNADKSNPTSPNGNANTPSPSGQNNSQAGNNKNTKSGSGNSSNSQNSNNQQAGQNPSGTNLPDPTAGQGNSSNGGTTAPILVTWTSNAKPNSEKGQGGNDIVEYPFTCTSSSCFVYKADGSKLADKSGLPISFPLDPGAAAKGILFPKGMDYNVSASGMVAVTNPDGSVSIVRTLPNGTLNQWSQLSSGKTIYSQDIYKNGGSISASNSGNAKTSNIPNSNTLGQGTKNTVANGQQESKTGAVTALPKMVLGEPVD